MATYTYNGQPIAGAGIWDSLPASDLPSGVVRTSGTAAVPAPSPAASPSATVPPPKPAGVAANAVAQWNGTSWQWYTPPSPTLTGQSVSTASLLAAAGITPTTTGSTVAAGFDIFDTMFKNLISANADRRASIDQTLSTITLLSQLQRVSPTTAANFAASLGMPGAPDLGFVNNIDRGASTRVTGRAGNQQISLPLSLTGKSLDFLKTNPNIASIVQDVANSIGLPDIFSRSSASAIPTSAMLAGLAA